MRGGNIRGFVLYLLSSMEVGRAIVGYGGNYLVPCWRGLLNCGVAIRGAWQERVIFEAEGPNAHEERVPSIVKVDDFRLLKRNKGEK
jgi:hypothetical protein